MSTAMQAAHAAQRRLLDSYSGRPGMTRSALEKALATQTTLAMALWALLCGALPADPQAINSMPQTAFMAAIRESNQRGTQPCH